jgi:hypothetical protein
MKDPEGLVPRPVMHAAWPVRKSAHPLTFNKNTTRLSGLRELQVCYPSGPLFLRMRFVPCCLGPAFCQNPHGVLWKELAKREQRNEKLKTALSVASFLFGTKRLKFFGNRARARARSTSRRRGVSKQRPLLRCAPSRCLVLRLRLGRPMDLN